MFYPIPYFYNGHLIRVFCIENQPWFALSDICEMMCLSNASSVAARLEDYEQMTLSLASSHSQQRGGAQKLLLINFPGLCHVLFSSSKPEAKPFQRWALTEVLPSIFKNGGYILGQNSMDAGELLDVAMHFVQKTLAEQQKKIETQAAYLCELEPKGQYYDTVLRSPGAIPITVIAKEFGLSAQALNSYLHAKKVQYKCGGVWVLYQRYANEGYTLPQTILKGSSAKQRTLWTQKGRAFIHSLLKTDGILPLSERMDALEDIQGF